MRVSRSGPVDTNTRRVAVNLRSPILSLVAAVATLISSAPAVADRCAADKGTARAQDGQCSARPREEEWRPTAVDFDGPRETWRRLGEALKRGDKETALAQYEASVRPKFAQMFDYLFAKTGAFDLAQLGELTPLRLIGPGYCGAEAREEEGRHQLCLSGDDGANERRSLADQRHVADARSQELARASSATGHRMEVGICAS